MALTIDSLKSSLSLIDWSKLYKALIASNGGAIDGFYSYSYDNQLSLYVYPDFYTAGTQREGGFVSNYFAITLNGANLNTSTNFPYLTGSISSIDFWDDQRNPSTDELKSNFLFAARLEQSVSPSMLLDSTYKHYNSTSKSFDAGGFARDLGIIIPTGATYSIGPSTTTINEGQELTTTVSTEGVAAGTTLYWQVFPFPEGSPLTDTDLSAGALSGSGNVGTDGKFIINHTLRNDQSTREGDETFQIRLFKDTGRTQSVAQTDFIIVKDTSKAAGPAYSISPSLTTINEGQTLTTMVSTTGVATGTTLYWAVFQQISGKSSWLTGGDFSVGALSGSGQVDSNGQLNIIHTLNNDQSSSETDELVFLRLFTDSGRNQSVAETPVITVKDTSKAAAPTYTIAPSPAKSINEGQQLTTTIRTTGMANGTTLYWGLSGKGINSADLSAGALTGQGTVNNNVFSFPHTLANDLTTNEGNESLQIKLFSDAARTRQLGSTSTVTVKDTSKATAPTYTIAPSPAKSINEGQQLTTTIRTTGVANGTTLYWGLSGKGINSADFSTGALTGQGTVNNNVFSFPHTLANDLTTNEGNESLQIKLFSDAARTRQLGSTSTVTVKDTSKAAAPKYTTSTARTYTIAPSASSINEGQQLTTTIRTTGVANGTTLYWRLSGKGINSADFSAGALTGQGTVKNNVFSFPHTLANDLSTNEGNESLQIKLFSDAARTRQLGSTSTVTVKDTSKAVAPTYSINGVVYNSDLNGKPLMNLWEKGWVKFIQEGTWKRDAPTYVFAAGWNDNYNTLNRANPLWRALNDTYGSSANVVAVDWSSLTRGVVPMPYPSTEAGNAAAVGEIIADALIKAGAKPETTTLIGHSLSTFAMGAAANSIKQRAGLVRELVALDIAFKPDGSYDIDNRISGVQAPHSLGSGLARETKSYTVSTLNGLGAVAGDESAALTADRAYIVQYSKSDFNVLDTIPVNTAYHIGVMGVYGDLVRKGMLDANSNFYTSGTSGWDSSGKPVLFGLFDGVVVAAQPWVTQPSTFRSPKAIGWTTDYAFPAIYGSSRSDIMFYDRFDKNNDSNAGVFMNGGDGDDWLIGDESEDNLGIDVLTGGGGRDTFAFGYTRYGKLEYPYDDKAGWNIFDNGLNAYAVIKDLSLKEDRMHFVWSIDQIGYRDGSSINNELEKRHGKGIGILANDDVIAYLPGITSSQAQEFLRDPNKATYLTQVSLDDWLFNAA